MGVVREAQTDCTYARDRVRRDCHPSKFNSRLDNLRELATVHALQGHLHQTPINGLMLFDEVIDIVGHSNNDQCCIHCKVKEPLDRICKCCIQVWILDPVELIKDENEFLPPWQCRKNVIGGEPLVRRPLGGTNQREEGVPYVLEAGVPRAVHPMARDYLGCERAEELGEAVGQRRLPHATFAVYRHVLTRLIDSIDDSANRSAAAPEPVALADGRPRAEGLHQLGFIVLPTEHVLHHDSPTPLRRPAKSISQRRETSSVCSSALPPLGQSLVMSGLWAASSPTWGSPAVGRHALSTPSAAKWRRVPSSASDALR